MKKEKRERNKLFIVILLVITLLSISLNLLVFKEAIHNLFFQKTNNQLVEDISTTELRQLLYNIDKIYLIETIWENKIQYYHADKKTGAYYFQKNIDGLPNLLIIGDSISEGYTKYIQNEFINKINVYRIPTNIYGVGFAFFVLKELIGKSKFDIIVFNIGLHDLSIINGEVRTNLEDYEYLLDKITTEILIKHSKHLLFVMTTHVPEKARYKFKSETEYNKAARKIMLKNSIKIIDMPSFMKNYDNLRASGDDVHYSDDGYQIMAKIIIENINQILKKNRNHI